jgi:hypothetical protein
MQARSYVLVLLAAGLVIGFASTLRLGAVVAATPTSLLFDEPLRLIDPDAEIGWDARARADAISERIGDPGLVRARVRSCQPDGETGQIDFEACLAAIEDGLAAGPASGELWLYKAMMMARSGEFGPGMADALRNAYRMAPHEGWIATPRVIFGLQLYPLLPDDVQEEVKADLVQIIGEGRLSHEVARAYALDPGVRDAGGAAVRSLPPDLLFRFTSITRQAAMEAAAAEAAAGEGTGGEAPVEGTGEPPAAAADDAASD